MALDDLIMTIDSDEEDNVAEEPPIPTSRAGKKGKAKADVPVEETLNPDFTFDITGDVYDEVLGADRGVADLVKGSKRVSFESTVFLP